MARHLFRAAPFTLCDKTGPLEATKLCGVKRVGSTKDRNGFHAGEASIADCRLEQVERLTPPVVDSDIAKIALLPVYLERDRARF